MWVLRQYSKATSKLLSEFALEGFRLQDVETLVGHAPTKFGSTPVDHSVPYALLGRGAPIQIERDSAFYLDFDAEPEVVERYDAPETAVTT